jgi:uncharacterized membrane protein HdeD (DUF308 family)
MTDATNASPLPDLAAVGKAIWWMVLLRGIAAIVFGILVFVFSPDVTLVALAILFAAYSIVDGVMGIAHALRVRSRSKRWGWLLLSGILSVLAGLIAAFFPLLTGFFGALVITYLIAFWSIFVGVAGFPAAHAMADGGRKTWAYVTSALAVLFGIALVVIATLNPGGAVQALIWTIGAYAIVSGVLLIVLAIGTRSVARRISATP